MKTQTMIGFLLVSLTLFSSQVSAAQPLETLQHNVSPGKWHKSGDLNILQDEIVGQTFKVTINYNLKPKGLMGRIIKPFLKGEYIFDFPKEMLFEEGYESLETGGPIELRHEDKVATLKYLKQVDIDGYVGAHKVEIRSKSTVSDSYPDGKWHIHLYYHPSVPSVGLFKSEIFYHGKAGNYEVYSFLK